MQRVLRGRRVLDADVVLEIGAGEEVLQVAAGAADLQARLDMAAAADRQVEAAFVRHVRALGANVDHAGGAVAVLRRQRAGQHRHLVGEAGVEHLPEAADRLGDHHAVDAVLQVGVVAAHVQLAVRIADHAGCTQQDLIERRGVAERQLGDVGLVEAVDRAAGFRRQRVARGVELFARALDDDGLELRGGGRGRRGCRRGRLGEEGVGRVCGAAAEGERDRAGQGGVVEHGDPVESGERHARRACTEGAAQDRIGGALEWKPSRSSCGA